MDVKYTCPHCSQHILFSDAQSGVSVPCPNCGVGFKLELPGNAVGNLKSVRVWIIGGVLAVAIMAPLLKAMTDNPLENQDARHMATQYLGDFMRADPEALAALERLANDPDPAVQALARAALDRNGAAALVFTDDRMTTALKNYSDGDPQVRRGAVEWVKQNGGGSVPELLAFLENPQLGGRERALAAQALGNAGKNGEAEVSALLRAVKDREPSVREYAALALASLDHKHSFTVPIFIGLLSDANARIRRRAAEHLDSISGFAKPAIPELVDLIEREKDPQVLNAAKTALKHIQAKTGS